jgi:hypothetical protein
MLTPEDAKKIGDIAGTTDGGCSTCVANIVERLNKAFPEYRWAMTGREQPPEIPDWSDDPEDGFSPGLEVIATPNSC